jgi:hypothetical protein
MNYAVHERWRNEAMRSAFAASQLRRTIFACNEREN